MPIRSESSSRLATEMTQERSFSQRSFEDLRMCSTIDDEGLYLSYGEIGTWWGLADHCKGG